MEVKKKSPRKYRKKTSQKKKLSHEIEGVLLLAAGVLLAFSLYAQSSIGVFGNAFREIVLGMFGLPAYVMPPALILYAIMLIFNKTDEILTRKVIYSGILLLLFSGILHTGFYDRNQYQNMAFTDSLVKFYTNGISLQGGGVIGGLVCTPFILVFQVLGTLIILTALSVIDIILLTNISIASLSRKIRDLLMISFKSAGSWIVAGIHQFKERNSQNDQGPIPGQVNLEGLELGPKSRRRVIDFKMAKDSRKNRLDQIEETGEGDHHAQADDLPDGHLFGEYNQQTVNHPSEKPLDFHPGRKSADDKDSSGSSIVRATVPGDEDDGMDDSAVHGVINATPLFHASYRYPSIDLLFEALSDGKNARTIKNSSAEVAKKLEDTLKSFGVEARVINVSSGPAVTRFELQPSPGVKVSKIVNLSDDIALNLAASGVRIEAPIPGKAAIGIEVPNKEVAPVYLKEVIKTDIFTKFGSKLAFALGKDISGDCIVADIAKMPHMLIAGSTGSGKSVCINSLIISLLYKATPDEIKLLMIDPKVVELGIYNGIPHLLIPVVTDPKKAAGALNWAVQEMVNRYKLFAQKGVRDLKGYNEAMKEDGETGNLPQIVIIIDELADLMMVAPNDVEDSICRLAQMARAAGMHLVIATQRPSVDVITGIIKANIPSRISFAVTSQVDSRTILDMAGAEKLLGKGDMLFHPVGEPKPIRIKGAFVTDKEVEKVVDFVKSQGITDYNVDIIEEINTEKEATDANAGDNDELLPQAIELVVEAGQASVSLIQRKFKVGYARAARIIDQMEERGIVGRFEGSKPRQVLLSRQQLMEMQFSGTPDK